MGFFPRPHDASKAKMAKQEWSNFVDKAWKKSQMRSSDVKFNGLLMESGERSNKFNIYDCIHGKTKAQHHVTVFHNSSKQPSSKHPLCLAKVFAVCTTNFLRRKCLLLRICPSAGDCALILCTTRLTSTWAFPSTKTMTLSFHLQLQQHLV
jgi:hypothetical protein